jgi:hypothetical protein
LKVEISDGHCQTIFARNNDWIVNTARLKSHLGNLFAILVWYEKLTGAGSGGTSDFAAKIEEWGGRIAIINPTTLESEGESKCLFKKFSAKLVHANYLP